MNEIQGETPALLTVDEGGALVLSSELIDMLRNIWEGLDGVLENKDLECLNRNTFAPLYDRIRKQFFWFKGSGEVIDVLMLNPGKWMTRNQISAALGYRTVGTALIDNVKYRMQKICGYYKDGNENWKKVFLERDGTYGRGGAYCYQYKLDIPALLRVLVEEKGFEIRNGEDPTIITADGSVRIGPIEASEPDGDEQTSDQEPEQESSTDPDDPESATDQDEPNAGEEGGPDADESSSEPDPEPPADLDDPESDTDQDEPNAEEDGDPDADADESSPNPESGETDTDDSDPDLDSGEDDTEAPPQLEMPLPEDESVRDGLALLVETSSRGEVLSRRDMRIALTTSAREVNRIHRELLTYLGGREVLISVPIGKDTDFRLDSQIDATWLAEHPGLIAALEEESSSRATRLSIRKRQNELENAPAGGGISFR